MKKLTEHWALVLFFQLFYHQSSLETAALCLLSGTNDHHHRRGWIRHWTSPRGHGKPVKGWWTGNPVSRPTPLYHMSHIMTCLNSQENMKLHRAAILGFIIPYLTVSIFKNKYNVIRPSKNLLTEIYIYRQFDISIPGYFILLELELYCSVVLTM